MTIVLDQFGNFKLCLNFTYILHIPLTGKREFLPRVYDLESTTSPSVVGILPSPTPTQSLTNNSSPILVKEENFDD